MSIFGWWGNSATYDANNAVVFGTGDHTGHSRPNIMEGILRNPYCYNDTWYPGENKQEIYWQNDPLGRWNLKTYTKINVNKVEWVLENIFNCPQPDIRELQYHIENQVDWAYRLGDYYYVLNLGVGGGFIAKVTDIQYVNQQYQIAYDMKIGYDLPGYEFERYYALMDKKHIGDKDYWSLYYSTKLQPNQDPLNAGGFIDVDPQSYYCPPIIWALNSGITKGTGTARFSPQALCSRAQIATFLWRFTGEPPAGQPAAFTDMTDNATYNAAISWAVEAGVTSGTSTTAFSPHAGCTRAQAVTFLWRAAGRPDPIETAAFIDMPKTADFQKAISWASENGITSGTGAGFFSPNRACTRGEIAAFLYRAKGLIG